MPELLCCVLNFSEIVCACVYSGRAPAVGSTPFLTPPLCVDNLSYLNSATWRGGRLGPCGQVGAKCDAAAISVSYISQFLSQK